MENNMENNAENTDSTTTTEKPTLQLTGRDGNAFSILGAAQRVARKNKMNWDAIMKEATSGDYDHLLRTMCKYFDVE